MKHDEMKAIFAASAAKDGKELNDFDRLATYVAKCVHQGQLYPEPCRNACGYDSDLPTKEINNKTGENFTRRELFSQVWNRVQNKVRTAVFEKTAEKCWGFSIKGMSGVSTLVQSYGKMIETGEATCKIIGGKEDIPFFKDEGIPVKKRNTQGQRTYELNRSQLLKWIGRKFAAMKLDVAAKDAEFAQTYKNGIQKYLILRTGSNSFDVSGSIDELQW